MAAIADSMYPQDLTVLAQHFQGVGRYVSDPGNPKNMTRAEFDATVKAGLTVTIVCEQGAEQSLRGAPGGSHDALVANQACDGLGFDRRATIYYVAEDPSRLPQSEWPIVVNYFSAINAAGMRSVGGYGSLPLLNHLQSLGLITKKWVVSTWGGTDATTNLDQLVGAPQYGLSVDTDTILTPDYGQHPRPTIVTAPTPTPAPTPPLPTSTTTTTEDVYMIPTGCTDQGAVNAQIKEWWVANRTDALTADLLNLLWADWNLSASQPGPFGSKGFGRNPFLLLSNIIDNAGPHAIHPGAV